VVGRCEGSRNLEWGGPGPLWVAAPQEKWINEESNWTIIITRFSNVTQFVICLFSNCLFLHVNVPQNYKLCNKSLLISKFQEIYTTNKQVYNARFEVFIAVAVKIHVFWDMTPCPLVHSCRRFGECLCFQIHYISCWYSICTQNGVRNEGSKLLQDYLLMQSPHNHHLILGHIPEVLSLKISMIRNSKINKYIRTLISLETDTGIIH